MENYMEAMDLTKRYRSDINQTSLTETLKAMEIGDSFIVDDDVQLTRVNVCAWAKRHHRKFSITRQGDVHVCERVPRIVEKKGRKRRGRKLIRRKTPAQSDANLTVN